MNIIKDTWNEIETSILRYILEHPGCSGHDINMSDELLDRNSMDVYVCLSNLGHRGILEVSDCDDVEATIQKVGQTFDRNYHRYHIAEKYKLHIMTNLDYGI
jgi:hypothetical protein